MYRNASIYRGLPFIQKGTPSLELCEWWLQQSGLLKWACRMNLYPLKTGTLYICKCIVAVITIISPEPGVYLCLPLGGAISPPVLPSDYTPRRNSKVLALVRQNLESAEQLLRRASPTGCVTAAGTAAIHWRKWSWLGCRSPVDLLWEVNMSAMLEFALRYFMPENVLLTLKSSPSSGADEQVVPLEEVASLCDQAFGSDFSDMKSPQTTAGYSQQ